MEASETKEDDVLIDCDRCAMQGTAHCRECVVSCLLDPEPGGGVIVDIEEERALRELARAGLVGEIRMRPRADLA